MLIYPAEDEEKDLDVQYKGAYDTTALAGVGDQGINAPIAMTTVAKREMFERR